VNFQSAQALNILAALHPSLAVINTSQSVDLMQVIQNDSDPLPCLTSTGQHVQFQFSSLDLNEWQHECVKSSFDVGLFLIFT
jgi:hypothetical protein